MTRRARQPSSLRSVPRTDGGARASRSRDPRAGFTLIELLTVIAIIGILAAILIPSIASCRRQANKSREVSAARQLMVAYLMASDENRGTLVSANDPGKTDKVLNETGQAVHAIAAGR